MPPAAIIPVIPMVIEIIVPPGHGQLSKQARDKKQP
jgi:hypothetical protein